MVGRTRTCEILLIPNQAFYQLNYYHIYTVEQVGYDPTPSVFQTDAMTTSATAPITAEDTGFEPVSRSSRLFVFKTNAIIHSANLPNL